MILFLFVGWCFCEKIYLSKALWICPTTSRNFNSQKTNVRKSWSFGKSIHRKYRCLEQSSNFRTSSMIWPMKHEKTNSTTSYQDLNNLSKTINHPKRWFSFIRKLEFRSFFRVILPSNFLFDNFLKHEKSSKKYQNSVFKMILRVDIEGWEDLRTRDEMIFSDWSKWLIRWPFGNCIRKISHNSGKTYAKL